MEKPVEQAEQNRFAKGIYLLPNLFTTGALFAGFYAIVAAMKGLYVDAAVTIFIAMIADGLDGRIARLTNTASAFGAEYDSLSDMVAFGVAPALVAYSWALHTFGKFGWLIAFFYAAATALRLARFNVNVGDENDDKRFFYGLPCPSAAAIVASTMWVQNVNGFNGFMSHVFLAVITVFVAIMMVSNVRYYSFKKIDMRGSVPFFALLIIVLLFVGIAIDPPSVLFLGFGVFAFSGPVLALLTIIRRKKVKKENAK